MNAQNEKDLTDNFSFLAPKTENVTGTYLSVGDGWLNLIKETCEKIKTLGLTTFKVDQIKSKHGGLRFDYDGRTVEDDKLTELENILQTARTTSGSTCETCGNPGNFVRTSWDSGLTLCSSCKTKFHL